MNQKYTQPIKQVDAKEMKKMCFLYPTDTTISGKKWFCMLTGSSFWRWDNYLYEFTLWLLELSEYDNSSENLQWLLPAAVYQDGSWWGNWLFLPPCTRANSWCVHWARCCGYLSHCLTAKGRGNAERDSSEVAGGSRDSKPARNVGCGPPSHLHTRWRCPSRRPPALPERRGAALPCTRVRSVHLTGSGVQSQRATGARSVAPPKNMGELPILVTLYWPSVSCLSRLCSTILLTASFFLGFFTRLRFLCHFWRCVSTSSRALIGMVNLSLTWCLSVAVFWS